MERCELIIDALVLVLLIQILRNSIQPVISVRQLMKRSNGTLAPGTGVVVGCGMGV